jgi:predicted RNase H-like HicB family nuclease
MVLQIQVNLSGAIRHDEDAGVFVSYCPALKLYSQGESEVQAMEALKSAVGLFLTTCFERNQLDAALRDAGFNQTSAVGLMPVEKRMGEWIEIREAKFDDAFEFTVPINLIAAKNHRAASECPR